MDIILETNRLTLHLIKMSHLELYFDFLTRNAEFFKPWSPKYENGYFELDYHKERLQKIEMDIKEGAAVKFGVFLKNDISKIIGTVSFMNIIKGPFQSCFLGYRFDEKENNKGYATEAIRESIDYIFYAEKLHRIEANIIPRNKPSIRVVEKLGFVNEGLSKKYLQINGKWEDHIHYVLLND